MGTAFTSAVTEVWTQTTAFLGTVTDSPILVLPIAVGFGGAIVGLVRRMTKIGGGRRR